MESKEIIIERAHRTGSKINGRKRAIVVKLLTFKYKDAALNQYRQKQIWKDNIYVNEDYSQHTAELRKQLFKQAREILQPGKFVKVVYKKVVVSGINKAT